jgi:L-amino acid N-acyltransferase YncA
MPVAEAADEPVAEPPPAITIRPMTEADWPAVARIYAEGIATGLATFETEVPEWRAFIATHRPEARLVATEDGVVVGWVALARWSSRDVYAGVSWESVYVAANARGRGVGRALLGAAIRASEAAGIWTLTAGIMADNAASIAVHERVGFRRIGVQERVGRDASGRWRDVLLYERRSTIVGSD